MSQAKNCNMQVRVFPAAAQFDDPTDFRTEAAAFFDRIDPATLGRALRGVPAGAARNATALFQSNDTRWRLLRPLEATARPDAFVVAPAQTQYLIQPPQGALYAALVLVGLPQTEGQSGPVTHPALTGTLSRAAAAAAGQIFTIEPRQPERCTLDPSRAAAQAQDWLKDHLT